MWLHTWANNSPQWISTAPAWVQGINLEDDVHGGGIDDTRWIEEEQIIMVIISAWLMLTKRK